MGEAAKLFTRSLLMGLDSSVRKEEFAEPSAEDIENMPYHEAVEYLKKRDVIKKVDYNKLSDKMKFRAFTASRINDGKLLERLNAEMIANVNDGKGLKDFLSMTKTDILDKVGMGPNQGWYWETVYRTNVQTAYNAGRMMGFEEDKPLALHFIGIEDARQTDICHSMSNVIRPYDDPIWQKYIPPLHFGCRSTVRAIYDRDELPEEWTNLEGIERPAKGFGTNPVSSDSWWDELESQVRQAKHLGVQGEIEAVKAALKVDKISETPADTTAKESIEKLSFYSEDLKDEDKPLFDADYKKASNEAKNFISRYGKGMRMDCYADTGGYYSPADNKIHFNINKPRAESTDFGYKKNMVTFFHETGHWLDYNALGEGKTIRDGLPKLKALLEKDALDYVNHFQGKKGTIKNFLRNSQQEKKLMTEISKDIWKNSSTNSNISDIFEGVTNGKIVDGYGHGKAYWKRSGQLEKEAVAEMFETLATGGVRKEAMQKYFPNAYKYFESYIKELLK